MLHFDNSIVQLYQSDARSLPIPDNSVDCVVTSPPYWGLRDYNTDGQLGLEETPEEYCATMVAVFREVWRVLKPTGTVWLNLGDSYSDKQLTGIPWRVAFALQDDGWYLRSDIIWSKPNPMPESVTDRPTKAHEYVFLLTKSPRYYYDADAIREQGQGYGRSENFRSTGYENNNSYSNGKSREGDTGGGANLFDGSGRNKRTVWEIPTQPYPEAHFATYPEKLVEPCILAGTSEKGVCSECGKPWERTLTRVDDRHWSERGDYSSQKLQALKATGFRNDGGRAFVGSAHRPIGWEPTCECNADTVPATVLDPFAGSGTTMAVAQRLGRKGIGTDISKEYLQLAEKRICNIPLSMSMFG